MRQIVLFAMSDMLAMLSVLSVKGDIDHLEDWCADELE